MNDIWIFLAGVWAGIFLSWLWVSTDAGADFREIRAQRRRERHERKYPSFDEVFPDHKEPDS